MFAINMPPDRLRAALILARGSLATRVVQLSNCRVCGADLQKYEQALGTVRELLDQLGPRDASVAEFHAGRDDPDQPTVSE